MEASLLISGHAFRPTGITTYLRNGGNLEVAQQMAAHESARTAPSRKFWGAAIAAIHSESRAATSGR
jgi:integrase